MREWIQEQLERFEVPGAAVAVVADGKVVLQEGFGLRDVASGAAVTPQTAFAIASATKAFTAAGVGALVDEGLLEWDRPLRHYLKDFELSDHVATERLTVRDALSHRSGLPRHDLVWYGNDDLTRADIVDRLRHLQPSKDFRTTWQYNNLMYLTAGHLCEVVTGQTWEDLVRQRLLTPLGMSASTFSWEEAGELTEVSLPYDERGGVLQRVPYAPKPASSGPAGSIYSTLEDMLSWLQVNLDGGQHGGRQVLAGSTVAQLHAAQTPMTAPALFPEAVDNAYGLGWMLSTYRGHRMVHHGGNIDGFTSLVSFLPDAGVGMVFLSNRHATMLRAATAYHVYDDVLGLEPLPWADRFQGLQDSLKVGGKEAKASIVSQPDRPPAHPLEEYAGTYEHPAYGRFTITVTGEGLEPHFRELPLTLTHRHFETFDAELASFDSLQLPLTFRTDPEGDVVDFTLPVEPTVDPIVFTRLPDPRGSDPEVLDRLVGSYESGTLVVEVEQTRPGVLTVSMVPMLPATTLVPHRGTTYRLQGQESVRARFVLDGDGPAGEVVVQPLGVFVRRSRQG